MIGSLSIRLSRIMLEEGDDQRSSNRIHMKNVNSEYGGTGVGCGSA